MSWGIEFPSAERDKPHKPECEMAKECLPDGPHWPDSDGLSCLECGAVCICADSIDALR